MTTTKMQDKSDDDLIGLFVNEANQKAFDVLLRRYYNMSYHRALKNLHNEDEARDICQKLWMKVLSAFDSYEYNDKFENFLNTILTNLLKDEWRSQKANRVSDYVSEEEDVNSAFDEMAYTNASNPEEELENRRLMNKLVHELIPALPKEQRLVYLLKHEAELWDKETPLQWQHLGDLVAMSVDNVSEVFDSARDKVFKNTSEAEIKYTLDEDEQTVFLVWTLSQRYDKRKKYTETYFAELLNISVNTLKTRYRSAVKNLAAEMNS